MGIKVIIYIYIHVIPCKMEIVWFISFVVQRSEVFVFRHVQPMMVLSYWNNPLENSTALEWWRKRQVISTKSFIADMDPSANLNTKKNKTTVVRTSQSLIKTGVNFKPLSGMMAWVIIYQPSFLGGVSVWWSKNIRALRNKKRIHMGLSWICSQASWPRSCKEINTWHLDCSFQIYFPTTKIQHVPSRFCVIWKTLCFFGWCSNDIIKFPHVLD